MDDPKTDDQLVPLSRSATGVTMDFLCEGPEILLWDTDTSRRRSISCNNGGNSRALNYLDAFLTGAVDTALAAQNAAVAAESLGLGIVYLGMMGNTRQ